MAAAARAAVANASHLEVKQRTDEELMAELAAEQAQRAEEERLAGPDVQTTNPYLLLAQKAALFTTGEYAEAFGMSIMVRARRRPARSQGPLFTPLLSAARALRPLPLFACLARARRRGAS